MTTTIRVYIETEPHTQNLAGVVLNSPAPQSGSFMIDQRVPASVWNEMKKAGAHFLSEDDLEDMDMFTSVPGWRYTLDALAVLVRHGYTLAIRDEMVTTEENLRALFTEEAKAAYWVRVGAERAQAKRDAEEAAEAKRAEAERLGAEYKTWRTQRITGLAETFAGPSQGEIEWRKIAYFSPDVPDAWSSTGDAWFVADIDGETVYRKSYGNAEVYYAPQGVADNWVLASWDRRVRITHRGNEVEAARWVLRRNGQDCIFDDIATRLVENKGIEYFVEIARRETWLLTPTNNLERQEAETTAKKYGLDLVVLDKDPQYYRGYDVMRKFDNPAHPGELAQTLWRHPHTSQWYAKSYHGTLWPVNNVN